MTGFVTSLQYIVQILFATPAGKLLARRSYHLGMHLGAAALLSGAIVGACAAWFQMLPILLLSRLLSGLGLILWSLSRQSLIAAAVPRTSRGRVQNLTSGLTRWGS